MRHPSEERLLLQRYGDVEPPEDAAIAEHLLDCSACRERAAELERAVDAMRQVPVPARPEDYGAQVWARLQPRLADVRRGELLPWWRRGFSLQFRPLAYAAGVAVLVVAAFVAGRFWPADRQPRQAAGASVAGEARPASAERVRERVLVLAVGEHLERTQVALLEVMNAPGDDEGPVDLSGDQERVRELLAENRLYRLTAVDAGENGMAAVLDELERVLVEIANSPSEVSGTQLEHVRGEIDAEGLLLKVRVLGDTLRQRQARMVG